MLTNRGPRGEPIAAPSILVDIGTIEQEMAAFDSTIQELFEFRTSEIMKTDGIRKQAISNYFYHWFRPAVYY